MIDFKYTVGKEFGINKIKETTMIDFKYTVGKEGGKEFIDIKERLMDKWVRRYYEEVDRLILQNMPQYILKDFQIKIQEELQRRKKFGINKIKEVTQ